MGKMLCFFFTDMADFEVTYALHVLALQGRKEIVTLAYEPGPVASKSGVLYQPHLTVAQARDLADVDGLLIPGGWNDEQRPELTELICRLAGEEKLLAAICRGPAFLARAGALAGKAYTTSFSPALAEQLGVPDPFDRANFRDADVVRDGNVVTAKGHAFMEFAIELCDYFGLFPSAEEKQQVLNMIRGKG